MTYNLKQADARRRGFTLVELLVVIGIIALLVSFLLPALNKARASAAQVACQSNVRQIGIAFFMFANDHKGRLPAMQGAYGPNALTTEYWQGDWLGDAAQGNNDSAAYFDSIPPLANPALSPKGTIWPYLGKYGSKALRCPATPEGSLNGGDGSNGKFDYQTFKLLSGAKLSRLKRECWPYWGNAKTYKVTTPMLIETQIGRDKFQPAYWNNAQAYGTNLSPGRTSSAHNFQGISDEHPAGGSLLGIDGSVYFYKRKKNAPDIVANCWHVPSQYDPLVVAPDGNGNISLANKYLGWGTYPP